MSEELCSGCKTVLSHGDRFCRACGLPVDSGEPVPDPRTTTTQPGSLSLDSPLVQGVIAFLAAAALSTVGWRALGAPAGLISGLFPDAYCGSSGYALGSISMYLCAARVGLLNLMGPILVTIALAMLRRPIGRSVQRWKPKLPTKWRFLTTPLLATGFFTMAYSGIHWETPGRAGLLPKPVFPALIGLIAFAAPYATRAINRRRPELFDRRDRVPAPVRAILVLITPLALSFLWTNTPYDVPNPVHKEQIVILLASSLGFLAFIPRSGSISGLARAVAREATRKRAK